MVKRTLSTLLSIALVIAPFSQANAATAKAGSTCTKLKATSIVKGKKFTCIKSGKKLVWDKGVMVKPPTTPITKLPEDIGVQKAFEALATIAKSVIVKPTDIKSVASSKVDTVSIAEIENRYSFVASFFDDLLPANTPVTLVISTNEEIEWAGSQLAKLNGNSFTEWLNFFKNPSLSSPCGPYYSAGSNGKTLDKRILNNYSLFGKSCPSQLPADENFKTTVEHEWVHNVQNAVSFSFDQNLNPVKQNMPCWFKEGQAVFYGSVLGYRNDYNGYLNVRKWNLKNDIYGNAQNRPDVSQTLQKLDESYDVYRCGNDGGYSIGSIAVEKMVLLKGHTGVIAFMKELKNQTSWQEAFEVVYGIDGDQWIATVGKDIAKEYSLAGFKVLPPAVVVPVCPTPSNSDQSGITRGRANALIGMSESQAEQCAASLNWGYRVGQRDSEMFATTMDYRLDRVTVTVMLGVVTRVDVG